MERAKLRLVVRKLQLEDFEASGIVVIHGPCQKLLRYGWDGEKFVLWCPECEVVCPQNTLTNRARNEFFSWCPKCCISLRRGENEDHFKEMKKKGDVDVFLVCPKFKKKR